MTIRVLLADDQALLRGTFKMLIDSCDDLEVVAEAADGAQAVDRAREHRPDVIVMDVRMPGVDGLTATETICADPDLTGTRVLILTTFENDEHVARALRAGASGFLGKYVTTDALLEAIRTVATGESLLSPGATKALISQFLATPPPNTAAPQPTTPGIRDLTNREREAMKLAADGKSNDEIARELNLSALTVRTHIQRAMTKLGARDRAQLVVLAYKNGLVSPDPHTP
ncbi:two-component system response regulator [Micromonospora sp. ATCC 39149]|uniref:Response regulator transcription factor n=1 Tax=Micromonospora carbonacea TaxID=47853 RepID=A0A7D6GAY3_9ACTN|nr:response regulator transcription factor [Micromonospora sp. ATCC 39149]EEP75004.1 two-component system response regulator [Micromonospora sp. ATCC 39149]QLK00744.1 response regulator transcription factor [Micromonospora carbonacea]